MKQKRKRRPWVTLQYEALTPPDYTERGVESGAKLEEQIVGKLTFRIWPMDSIGPIV